MVEFCDKVVNSNWFKYFIIFVIISAGIVVGFETYEVEEFTPTLNFLNDLILWIFVIEIVLKMIALGKKWPDFFKDAWNIFDFLIVAVCFLPLNAKYVAVLRLARILRVMRLITAIPKLQILVGALLKSIPSMLYVSILLSLLFYIYAVMGTFMFGNNDPIHFDTLHKSMLTLFRVVTLEDWTDVMYIQMYGSDVYAYPEGVETTPQAYPIFGAFYFVSFVLVGTMIVLNLFIGVIMNGMDEVRDEEQRKNLAEARRAEPVDLRDEITYVQREMATLQEHLSMLYQRLTDEHYLDQKNKKKKDSD